MHKTKSKYRQMKFIFTI